LDLITQLVNLTQFNLIRSRTSPQFLLRCSEQKKWRQILFTTSSLLTQVA